MVKGPASSLLWLGLLLELGIDLWPGNFCVPGVWPKKKRERERESSERFPHLPAYLPKGSADRAERAS